MNVIHVHVYNVWEMISTEMDIMLLFGLHWLSFLHTNYTFKHRTNILYLVEKYQTVIIIGETGCGKSTQVCSLMTPKVIKF